MTGHQASKAPARTLSFDLKVDRAFRLDDLNDDERDRLRGLAAARSEPIETTFERFRHPKAVRRMPRRWVEHVTSPIGVEIAGAGVRGELAFIDLPNGRRLWSFATDARGGRHYEYLKDLVSPALSCETYRAAREVCSRYVREWSWYAPDLLPGPGGTIAEVGAFLGHKTLRFLDLVVGPAGRILAIEPVPENCSVLRRNVAENGVSDRITVRECAVWNEPGTAVISGAGNTRFSLVEIEGLDRTESADVPTETLDRLLGGWDVERIDFLDIRVNGAEYEVLEGLRAELPRIGIIYVAAPYKRGGAGSAERCRELLEARGCRILPQSTATGIYARPQGQ